MDEDMISLLLILFTRITPVSNRPFAFQKLVYCKNFLLHGLSNEDTYLARCQRNPYLLHWKRSQSHWIQKAVKWLTKKVPFFINFQISFHLNLLWPQLTVDTVEMHAPFQLFICLFFECTRNKCNNRCLTNKGGATLAHKRHPRYNKVIKKTPKTTPMTSPYLKPFPTLYYGSSSISEGASNYDPPAHLKDQLPMQSNLRQN